MIKISSFLLHEDSDSFLDGTINVEYMATTPSPYTHANDVHVRACARYESKPTSIVPSYYQPRFFFVPRAIHVDFRVFLDVTQDFVVVYTHIL